MPIWGRCRVTDISGSGPDFGPGSGPGSGPGHGPDTARLTPPRWRDLRVIAALIIREMGSTYGTSAGGYLWAILAPVGAIVLLSVCFSFMIHRPALGTSFVLFYATGYLPFDVYNQVSTKIATALRYTKLLIAYPGLSWMHGVLARLILTMLTSLTVFFVVIIGIVLVIETRTVIDIAPILIGLGLVALLGLGVGMMNCLLMGLFPVWERVWLVITRPLFLVSGLLFLYEDMPRFVQTFLWWNPILHVISLVRTGFYPTYHASFVSVSYVCILSLVLLALALIFLRRYYQRVLEM